MSVRLTVNFARTKGLPHQPETMIPGSRETWVYDSWEEAVEMLSAAVRTGRRINTATITALELADRNYERARR